MALEPARDGLPLIGNDEAGDGLPYILKASYKKIGAACGRPFQVR